ncbi:MAG: hypothetical protein AAF439_12860 [Pseudomonadota bacterium]
MPPRIKAILTCVVIAIAVVGWTFRDTIALTANPILLGALACVMIFAIWLFPEVKRDARGR